MKSKVLMVLICFTLTLSMVLGILAGCTAPATPKPTTPGATTKAPTTTAPGATTKAPTTSAPAPTKAGEVIKWKFQSGSSAGDASWWMQKEFCEEIKKASGGRLLLELFPAGAIVSRMEILDAVSAGSVEAGMNNDNDWEGKDVEFAIGCIPAGMEHPVQLCWFFFRNHENQLKYGEETVSPGNKLFDKLFAQYNIKAFPYTGTREVNYMANKKLVKPADYKGTTFRASAWEQHCIVEFGGKPVTMPSSDVYSALQTGVIDATQVGGASGNVVSGYDAITKYWGFPGMHNLGQSNHFMVNLDVWKKLPADLQEIFILATEHYYLINMAFMDVMDARMIPQLPGKGINLVYLSPEQQMNWRNAMLKTGANVYCTSDKEFKQNWDEALKFQYMMDAYFDLQHPQYDTTYPGKKETLKGFIWQ